MYSRGHPEAASINRALLLALGDTALDREILQERDPAPTRRPGNQRRIGDQFIAQHAVLLVLCHACTAWATSIGTCATTPRILTGPVVHAAAFCERRTEKCCQRSAAGGCGPHRAPTRIRGSGTAVSITVSGR